MLREVQYFFMIPLEKLQRCGFVPLRRDHCLQDLAFRIDRAPKKAELAIDLHKHLIQMPAPLRISGPDEVIDSEAIEEWVKANPE